MEWLVLSSFVKNTRPGWLFKYAPLTDVPVKAVPALYDHDRSRNTSNLGDWADYFKHALAGFRSLPSRRAGVGIITTFPQLAVCACLLKRLTWRRHLPVIAWMFNLKHPYTGVKGWLTRRALGCADRIVVHSRAEIDTYSRWLGLPRERFTFVPLTAEVPTVGAWQEREEAPYVVSLGTANRDYATLVKAVTHLGLKTIIVAGNSAVQGLELPPHVEVRSGLGLDECHRLVQQARVQVIPIADVDAPSGQVTLIESMMIGAPIVVTRCAGSQDYLQEGVEGLMVEAGDETALVRALERLWDDAGERRRLSAAARERALSQYSFPGAARAMAQILSQYP